MKCINRQFWMTRQQRKSLVNYYFRRAQLAAGKEFPDGRDSDLKARGIGLEWKRRVLLNEQRRAEKRFQQRVAQARQEAIKRWSGNVVHISEARR